LIADDDWLDLFMLHQSALYKIILNIN